MNPESFATTLLTILLDNYGFDALDWSPQTIAMELHDDFQVNISQRNLDKIMAAILIVKTDDFFNRLPVFNSICNILSGDTFDPTTVEPATVDEIAWAITEAVLLWPPEEGTTFDPEICGFIEAMLDAEGITSVPAILRFAVSSRKDDPISHLADDPEMYEAFSLRQQENKESVEKALRESLDKLMQQLADLQLSKGSTKDLVKKLRGALSKGS
jgi:hypothetical protein